jgi:ATP-dependent Clp protease ATP-binding subunit ClpB
MKFENYTQKAKDAVLNAQTSARNRGHQDLTAEHLLWALLEDTDGITVASLRRLNIDLIGLATDLDRALKRLPRVNGPKLGDYISSELSNVFRRAEELARGAGESEVAQDHVLVGIFDGQGAAADALRAFGVRRENLIRSITELGGRVSPRASSGVASSAAPASSQPAPAPRAASGAANPAPSSDTPRALPNLDRFSRDYTKLAKDGKIDPIVGRDDEMRRVLQILSRRVKNNPLLVGEAGVGKNAIIEGIAHRIASGDVPLSLKNKRLVSLDMGALVAGTPNRGDFENRIKSIIKEIQETGGEVLLYIDEIHTLASNKTGSADAASILKPALARGEIHCIGSTTVDEYRKYIEPDLALVRRFQKIDVEEPSIEQTIAILRGIKERYEIHHGVRISDAALIASAQLSARYVTDRNLPDKAIDLMDEAASQLRITIDSVPPEIDDIDRDIIQWEIERKALERETEADAVDRRDALSKKIENARKKAEEARAQWHKELETLRMMREAKEDLERARTFQREAERKGDFNRAAEFKHGKVPVLERTIELAEQSLKDIQKGGGVARTDVVRPEEIALAVSQMTGIPVAKMLESDRQKLVHMEDRLKQRVVGQDHAVKAISDAVRLSRAGIQDAGRPIGSFIFLGPTGVGKTELARALAEFLFDDEHAMVRLDMSEYMEKHAAARLVGAPPGYVGYDEGGQLTEAVKRRPYAVVLFDEIEKAHPDVFNLLLQLLDDGRLTDSKGRTVDFSNCVIIMTSNLGARAILELGPEQREEAEKRVREALREHFRPEFLNRIDETIIFRALDKAGLSQIADILLRKLRRRLDERKMKLTLSESARSLLIEAGYDPAYGARPLKRAVLSMLQKPLSLSLLRGDFSDGDEILVEPTANEEFSFAKKGAAPAASAAPAAPAPSAPNAPAPAGPDTPASPAAPEGPPPTILR